MSDIMSFDNVHLAKISVKIGAIKDIKLRSHFDFQNSVKDMLCSY